MSGLRYQDVELGDELPELHPDVSLENVRRFARASGMDRPRFTDHEGARKEGLQGALVPGLMSMGLLSAMVHGWAPGCRIVKLDTVFRAFLLVDSQPVCRGVVTDTDDESERIEIDLTILNEAGETRVLGTATVELKGQ